MPTKRVSKKRVSKKRVSKKRVSKKRVSKKRVSKKRVSKKRVSKKRASKKRVSKKRVSKKRVSKKRVSKKIGGGLFGPSQAYITISDMIDEFAKDLRAIHRDTPNKEIYEQKLDEIHDFYSENESKFSKKEREEIMGNFEENKGGRLTRLESEMKRMFR